MPEALKDARRCDPAASDHLRRAALEDVDLDPLHTHQGEKEPRTSYEETFSAIAGAP